MLKRCFYDGAPFEGEVFTFPLNLSEKKIVESPLNFCSLRCVKAHIIFNSTSHPNQLEMFTMYVQKKYGIRDPFPPAPSTKVLRDYRSDGQGITIPEFRSNQPAITFGLRGDHYNQTVQTSADESVVQLDFYSKILDTQYHEIQQNQMDQHEMPSSSSAAPLPSSSTAANTSEDPLQNFT